MASELFVLLEKIGSQYETAFQQLQLIDGQILATEIRLRRAVKNGSYHMKSTLALRLETLDEVRSLFYCYALSKGEGLEQLQAHAGLVDVTEDCDMDFEYDSDFDDVDDDVWMNGNCILDAWPGQIGGPNTCDMDSTDDFDYVLGVYVKVSQGSYVQHSAGLRGSDDE